MRIAFYAPLKSPEHEIPSGDRRVARLLIQALERAGHQVTLASNFRSLDIAGHPDAQRVLRDAGTALAEQLAAKWLASAPTSRPELWFSYHVYYKAPDWLGPRVSSALGIPYVISEASHAPKRANGPWAIGHDATTKAIRAASILFSPTRDDIACLESMVSAPATIRFLPPFLDVSPYLAALQNRIHIRERLATRYGLDRSVPWIVVAAMMRPGDKLSSYRMLARVLGRLDDLRWLLVIAGDGIARPEVETAFRHVGQQRVCFVGERAEGELAEIYAACDLCVWPAINEAYGMAMLEAQAAGVPVVSQALRGVPDVVCDGRTGLLSTGGDDESLLRLVRTLLSDESRCRELGRNAAAFVSTERSVDAAAAKLATTLAALNVPGTGHGTAEGGA